MAEEIKTSPADERLKKLNEVLDSYDELLKNKHTLPSEVEPYLNATLEDLQRYSADDLGYGAALLGRYATFLLKEQNRRHAEKRWLEGQIELTIAEEIEQYRTKFQSFEERKLLAIKHNEYANRLNFLRIKAESRLNEIYGMSKQIDSYKETILELQRSKRKNAT